MPSGSEEPLTDVTTNAATGRPLWQRAGEMHWFYTLCVLLAGLLFTWVTPPFQGPDEAVHLIRAIQLADGDVHGERHPKSGAMGTSIPVAVHSDLKFFSRFIFTKEVGVSREESAKARQASPPWNAELFAKREFAPCQFEHYPPVAHLPQALAVSMTYALGGTTFDAMYLGRVMNVLVAGGALGVAFWLLRNFPRLQLLCFAIAVTPAAASLYGSLAADAMTITVAVLVFALAVRLRERWDNRLFIALLAASAALSLCKNVYFLIPAVALPAIWWSDATRGRRIARIVILGLAAGVPLALWLWYIRDLTEAPALAQLSAKPADQAQKVLEAPFAAVQQWLAYLWRDMRYLRRAMVGVTGWGDMLMRGYILESYFWTLLAIAVVGSKQFREKRWNWADAAVRVGTAIAIALAIYMAIYVMTGRGQVIRTQGRYYLPILPLVLGALPVLLFLPKRAFGIWRALLLIGWASITGMAAAAVDARFDGPERLSMRVGEMHRATKLEVPQRGGFQKRENGDYVLRALASSSYELRPPAGAKSVEVEFGILDHAWRVANSDGVEFQVVAVMAGDTEQVLFTRYLDPKSNAGDRGPQTAAVMLPEKGVRRLLFRTLPGPSGSNAWDWAYWRRVDFASGE